MPNKEKEPRVLVYILEEGHLPVEIVKSIQGKDLVMAQLQVNGKKCEFEVDRCSRQFLLRKGMEKVGTTSSPTTHTTLCL